MIARLLEEPEMQFGRGAHVDPRFGLLDFGPADQAAEAAPATIPIGVVGTQETIEGVLRWRRRCRKPINPPAEKRTSNFFSPFPGFTAEVGLESELTFDSRLQRSIPAREIRKLAQHSTRDARLDALCNTRRQQTRVRCQRGETMAGTVKPGTAVLWLANDSHGHVFAMDLGGNVLVEIPDPVDPSDIDITGIAFDGTDLFFSAGLAPHNLTVRDKSTGAQTGGPFPVASTSQSTEDLAYDSVRNVLWRMDSGDGVPGTPPTLVQIKPSDGTVQASFPLSLPDPAAPNLVIAYGITYDSNQDQLYISVGDSNVSKGAIFSIDPKAAVPNIPNIVTMLFRKDGPDGFAMGGLAYQPGTGTLSGDGTLWVGGGDAVRHMTLAGEVLATVKRPSTDPPAGFVDGLEFIGSI